MSAAPTQQQRAFAQKLNKQGAAEVRKAVSSTIYSTSDLTRCASGLNLTVPLTDVVDPPDYEEFVLQNSCTVERDPFRDLILYPEDDVDVHSMPRKCRTVKPIVPELGPEADEFVFDLARRYTADYTVITRRYHRYSSSVCSKEKLSGQDATIPQEYEVDIEDAQDDEDDINKRQSIHMNSVPRGSWASSIFDLKSSQGDQLLPHLFDQVSYEQIDEDNRKCRQENREDTLFSLFPGEEEEDLIERRPSAPFPQEHFGHRIVVKCIQLKLELDFEPLFATVALYDAKEKKKSDVSTMSRAACFSITYPSPDVFLVIRLEKVLQQGDIGDCAEPYMREDKAKEDRLKSNAVQFCERLGKYRMPFAWTAIYLMNIVTGATGGQDAVKTCEPEPSRSSSLDRRSMSGIPGQFDSFRRRNKEEFSSTRRGSMERGRSERRGLFSGEDYGPSLDNFRPVTLTVSSFFKQEGDRLSDEDLYKFLADLKRPSSVLKRVKCIPGTLKLDISPCPEEPRYMLTPELYKVEPYPDEKTRPTRKKKTHYQQAIFGKSNCPELSREAYTAVTYHNKSPDFYEEIKVKLPAKLTDAHHLLFTFYHISCQSKKNESGPVEVPVGYTWLPLCREGKLMIDDFSIPVSVDKLPPSYSILFPDTNLPNMKWVDHKGLFNVSLRSMSSVHTQDDKLEKFLYNCRMTLEQKLPPRRTESQFENDLRLSIQDIPKSKGENLVQFLPLVLDRLLYLMVRPPILGGQQVNIGQPAFEGIILVVKRVHELLCDKNDRNGRNLTLASYIQYCCTLPHPGPLQHCATDPMLGSGYNTLGRPSSLPVSNKNFPRSSSNPDLNALTPTSPDNEISAILGGTKYLDRTGSMRADDFNQPQMVRNRAKKIKSMAEHLNKTQKLDTPRQMRFNDKPFVEDIEALMNLVNKEVTDKYIKEPQIIRSLNISLGFFLHDLLSFMDRGFVFNLIANYCGAIAEKIQTLSDSTTLMLLRLDFLRIVCSHEHYFPLNLPFGTPLTPTSGRAASPTPSIQSTNSMSSYTSTSTLTDRGQFYELTLQYRQQHFLVGLVLSDLKVALDTHNPIIHHKAINVVRNLLYNHDLDLRYMDTAMKSRLAALYMPIIGIVIEALPQLSDPGLDLRRHTSCPEEEEADKISHSVALEIAGATVFAGRVQEYPGGMDEPKSKKSPLTTECTRNLLICFLWVIKNADESVVRQWWSELNVNVLAQILDVLYFCISNFEYKPKWLKPFRLSAHLAETLFDAPRPKSASLPRSYELLWEGLQRKSQDLLQRQRSKEDTSQGKKSIAQCSKQTIQKSVDMKSRLEEAILGNLNARTEMMLRRRQTSYSQMAGDNGQMSSQGDSRLRWRKDQINYKPSLDQTESVKPRNVEADAHTEGSLAAEISMVALDTLELIIQIARSMEYTPLQSNALRILLHSLSLNQSTSVLKNMFATQRALVTRNFARVKMQVTMSLSKLVGQNQNFSEESLRRSLKTILTYAEEDADLAETPFTEQVKDLVFNLHMILSDTVKMKEFQEDPEMLLDLMYRIAKGYQNSPDLRLTWLHTMATKHSERNNHAEAAHCLVHAAGLIAEYLYMIEDKPYLPVGAVDFQKISVNVLEESAVSDDVVSPEEGVCTGKYFTENGLVGAGMYEHVNEVYKILIPIHESGRDYKKLGAIHNKLHEAFSNITRQASDTEGKRMFGTYFRVGFYGHKFGDLDGEEFVYKEPPITKLPEVAHRLEGFYSDRFGEGVVHIVKDSNPVDRESLDSAKAYIQITYVEPYFDLYEYRTKVTYFERNNNIKRFVFATPFTQDGRAHGEIHEQHKRKTILTTSHMFPYIKTRLQVISHDQVLLTPIEVAIEDIQKKTKELAVALYQEPPDTKILQMVLQGCIGTTVNQGPVEVAVVFLKDSPENKSQDVRHRNKLRLSFKDFLKKCSDALHKNKSLISSDQKEYQRELERNYHSVRDKLLPYISSNLATLKTKHHRR
uniref:Dedicator of cytokinesis protein 6 n=1 Tax=Magallana gigas TaxID=29159 RepID=K1RYN0_MAGGI